MRRLLLASFLSLTACASHANAGSARPAPGSTDSAAATIQDTLDAAGTINQMHGDTMPDTTSAQPDTTTSR